MIMPIPTLCLRQNLGDRRRQRRLAMINVTDRPDVAVRLRPLKLRLRHRLENSIRKKNDRISTRRRPLGAGDGNRTHVASLEGWSSTIELHPLRAATEAGAAPSSPPLPCARPQMTPGSGGLVEGVGFEPTKTYVGRFTVCCL